VSWTYRGVTKEGEVDVIGRADGRCSPPRRYVRRCQWTYKLVISSFTERWSCWRGCSWAAMAGQRGHTPARPLSNQLVFVGNMIGLGASSVGTVVLLYAAYVSLL
jgi:hypothetical protein